MFGWHRRRGVAESPRSAAGAGLEVRVAQLERRLEDLDDLARSALAPDRVDEVAERLEELVLSAATTEELLEVRLHSARVAVELTRVNAELRAELDQLRTSFVAEGRLPLDPFGDLGQGSDGLAEAG